MRRFVASSGAWWWWNALLVVVFAAAFLFTAWALQASRREACQSRDTTLNALSALLVDVERQTQNDPTVPAVKKQASARFMQEELRKIDAARC